MSGNLLQARDPLGLCEGCEANSTSVADGSAVDADSGDNFSSEQPHGPPGSAQAVWTSEGLQNHVNKQNNPRGFGPPQVNGPAPGEMKLSGGTLTANCTAAVGACAPTSDQAVLESAPVLGGLHQAFTSNNSDKQVAGLARAGFDALTLGLRAFAGRLSVTAEALEVPVAATAAPSTSSVAATSDDLVSTTLRQVESLDFSTAPNRAVFYSGPGNRARALQFAERTGATPIDHTPGGQYLESLDLYSKLPSDKADAIWKAASTRYAQGASGRINLFVKGARPDRVFRLVEEPILNESEKVYRWTFHY